MLPRTPEPELMDEAEQARAYAMADFASTHEAIADALADGLGELPDGAWVLDLGCGPADTLLRLARRYPHVHFVGVDGARAMLAHGEVAVAAAGLQDQVFLVAASLTELALDRRFDGVVSNSLLHHLHQPGQLWDTAKRWALPGAQVVITDLMRPDTAETLEQVVDEHGHGPDILVRDFRASLHAAFTPAEVADQLGAAGLSGTIDHPSERHLRVVAVLP